MLKKIALYGIGSIILLVVIGYIGITVPVRASIPDSELNIEQMPYAMRGNQTVGMQQLVIDDNNALSAVMWYPALNDANQDESITYAYPAKMGENFMVQFATYEGQAIADAPFDEGENPYPLVILSPGFGMGATAYGWLAEHLASYGFVVIAPEHQEFFDGELNGLWQSVIIRPNDILTVLNYLDMETLPEGMFEGLIDSETVAVVGHSYGGYTTLAAAGAQIDTSYFREHCETARAENHPAAWLCDETEPHLGKMATLAGLDSVPEDLWMLPVDSRIDAIVPIAGDAYFFGATGLAEITAPVMAIGGTADMDSPYDWATQPTFDYVSSTRRILVGLEGAEHMIFTAPCEAIPLLLRVMSGEFCDDGDWNRYDAHYIVKHFATAFLLAELQSDPDALTAIRPDTVSIPEITYEVNGY